jgi:hypothetical protein
MSKEESIKKLGAKIMTEETVSQVANTLGLFGTDLTDVALWFCTIFIVWTLLMIIISGGLKHLAGDFKAGLGMAAIATGVMFGAFTWVNSYTQSKADQIVRAAQNGTLLAESAVTGDYIILVDRRKEQMFNAKLSTRHEIHTLPVEQARQISEILKITGAKVTWSGREQ